MQISPLPTRWTYNCYSGCLTLVLERLGAPYSEPVALGLSRGLNLELRRMDDGFHFWPVRELHCVTEFLQTRGMQVQRRISPSPESFLSVLREQVAADMPMMVEYDGFYMAFTQIFRVKHERRIGLVVGHGQDGYRLTDPIYGVYDVPISEEIFNASRDRDGGACVEPAWHAVQWRREADDMRVDWRVVSEAIDDTAGHMLAPAAGHGAAGMRRLAARISEVVEDRHAPNAALAFGEELKQAAIAFNHYGEFLRWAARVSPTPATCEASAAHADKIGHRLKIAASLIWKAQHGAPERQASKLGSIFEQIAQDTEATFVPFRTPAPEIVS